MKITFLGTGTSQGIPVIGSQHPVCLSEDPRDKRLRTSIMVEWDNYRYIVDCGPDFRQQMIANNVNRIDGILFTHEHTDHIIGLDDIRPFYFREGEIPIYAQPRVLKDLKVRFAYIFQEENKYPGAPSVKVNILENKPFKLGNIPITPIKIFHGKLPIFGFRFDNFAYITDAKTIPPEEMEKLKGVKVLVLNALRKEPHHSHFNLGEALKIVEKIKPEKTYLDRKSVV